LALIVRTISSRIKRHAISVAASVAFVASFAPYSLAQYLSPSPTGSAYSITAPDREYKGLPIGAWMFYPQLLVGAVFDSNVFQSPVNPVSAVGLRLAPTLIADLNNGIHRTTLYGSMDGRFYASQGNAIDGRAGVTQVYEAMRDLIFRAQADYSRQTNIFTTGVQVTGTEPVVSPVGTTFANPSNQFTGMALVEKTLNNSFAQLRGSVVRTTYDNTPIPLGGTVMTQDGTVYTFAGRLGYWVTPDLNVFVEPSIDRRQYDALLRGSSGYGVVGGVASRQIGLFRGELSAGYQSEHYDVGGFGDVTSTVFSGRLYYEPTRYWRLIAALTRSLDVSVQASPLSPLGTPVRATAAVLQSNYALSTQWSATARLGYAKYEFIDNSRLDDAWLVGARVDYMIWQNMALSLDYQYTNWSSNVPLTSYTRHVITAGALYKY
jgi:hypothetical protein